MEKLKRILEFVSTNNNFYKTTISENNIINHLNIKEYPLIDRKTLQKNRYCMFSNGYQSDYYNQKLKHQSSSGSTGTPINVYWDYKGWYISNLSLWRQRKLNYGIKPNDRYISFSLSYIGINKDSDEIFYTNYSENELSINISSVMTNKEYLSLIEIINSFEPKWMYIQPSILNKLLYYYEKYRINIPVSLNYIETFGELLSLHIKRKTEKVFGIQIIDMYGSEEMNCIAYTSLDNHMYISDDNVYIEVYRDAKIYDEGVGEAVITNLNNYAMPLIRYLQGDVINLKVNKEKNKKEILQIFGRNSEDFYIENKNINSFLLSELIFFVNNDLDDVIEQFQFIYYKNITKLICNVVLDKERRLWVVSVKSKMEYFLEKKYRIHLKNFDVYSVAEIEMIENKYKTIIIKE